jgi:general stress protein 26
MPSRRDAIKMTPDEQIEFLEGQPFGVLGTIGPSGYPHQVTIGFALDGREKVMMASFAAAQKVRNVQRSPQASLLVEQAGPYSEIRGLLLSGPTVVVDEPGQVASWHDRLRDRARRLIPPTNIPAVDDERVVPKRVLLVLSVERAVSWDHRKLGGVY